MARKFSSLLNGMSPERRQRIAARKADLLAEMPLHELRKARDLSQEELAASLGVNQATVSKIERRTDMYISTMRRFVDAMGGQLEITARFPEGTIAIDQFSAINEERKTQTGAPKKPTSKKHSSAGSKALSDGRTAKESKSAAGSALSQRHGRKSGK